MLKAIRTAPFTAIAGIGVLLGGCTNLGLPTSTGEGVALRANFAAQVVDPTPAEGAPMMDADKADSAIQRYRDDEVKDPGDLESGDESVGFAGN